MRTLLLLLATASLLAAEDRLGAALAALRTAAPADREAAVGAVLALQPERAEVIRRLAKGLSVTAIEAGWHRFDAQDALGVSRPYQLYVPKSVAGENDEVPLLVYMHGGVSRPEFVTEEGQVGAGTLWIESAERAGFVVAFPLGRRDCTWWTAAGARHVRAVIRDVKRRAPIDDDRILGAGFSDGGSGCYYLAMAEPEPFAGFLALNGHPAVAAGASGEQLYLRNLVQTPLYAAMTADDSLYPAAAVLSHLVPALGAGASLRIVSYERGGHRPVYFEDLRETFEDFITGTRRAAARRAIDWWCASPRTGRVAWLEVLELGPAAGDAGALPDLNVMSRPGRVRLGFQVDRGFAGDGVKVDQVIEETTAQRIGLQAGDVLVQIDGTAVSGLEGLVAALGKKRYGQPVSVVVVRGRERVKLAGEIPPFVSEPSYRRVQPTARLGLAADGNVVDVLSRNVRRFRLYLPPGLFEPGPVKVVVNGRETAAAPADTPLAELLRRYAQAADRGRVFPRSLTVTLPAR